MRLQRITHKILRNDCLSDRTFCLKDVKYIYQYINFANNLSLATYFINILS